ncbi:MULTISPECIES: cell wall hydrolase [unclassified Novosphingobium]|uniref:cell wall hydrolase n=1 Tax=unclassified Novosphingobium TaxID=2644732 RepID=UPI00146B5942|nr:MULTISPECIES: cell wall hydrolase [unclassified Novosphingobium]NMN05755.1 spore germination cell wall hydrolase CwlJ-like protein [Novosphingobium sp. SG919]NMN87885.1 spore germination cell wall hydrolase CwlJ-like protein [Novosphingobium sp. SG916]
MTDPFRVARQALSGLLALAALLGAPAAQAQDSDHAPAAHRELQVVVAEGPANGAITLPTTGPATTTLPPARGMLALAPAPSAANAATLADLVEATPMPAQLSSELECLAGAVYFESKSESLAGQLAVARVIVARSQSGRYPASYCGVVYQPSQFSFVRGHAMPAINRTSRFWANAVRIAVIADQGAWKSPVEGALFFHAARVSPAWGKTRLAAIGGHIFYR